MSVSMFRNRFFLNSHYPLPAIRPVLHFLCILIITGIGIPTIACNGAKKQSTHDFFMGVDMKLPSNTVIKRDKKNESNS